MYGGGCVINAGSKRCHQVKDESDDEYCQMGTKRCVYRTTKRPAGPMKAPAPRSAKQTAWQAAIKKYAMEHGVTRKDAMAALKGSKMVGGGCIINPGSRRCHQVKNSDDDEYCKQGPTRCVYSSGSRRPAGPMKAPAPRTVKQTAWQAAIKKYAMEHGVTRKDAMAALKGSKMVGGGCIINPGSRRCHQVKAVDDDEYCKQGPKRCVYTSRSRRPAGPAKQRGPPSAKQNAWQAAIKKFVAEHGVTRKDAMQALKGSKMTQVGGYMW